MALGLCVLIASTLASDVSTLAVVAAVSGERTDAATAVRVWEAVQEVADRRLGVKTISLEHPGARAALDSVRVCGSELACVIERVRPTSARLALIITASLDLGLVTLSLIDADGGAEIARTEGDVRPETLLERVRALSGALFDRAGIGEAARLVLDVSPPDALVLIPTAPAAVSSGRVIDLPPGTHQIRASLAGYEDALLTVEAKAGIETRATLVLRAEPGFASTTAPWIVTGAGVALAGIGAALFVITDADRSDRSAALTSEQTSFGRVSLTRPEADALESSFAARSTTGAIFISAGAAILAGGLAWVLWER